jgi:hypothetical protein
MGRRESAVVRQRAEHHVDRIASRAKTAGIVRGQAEHCVVDRLSELTIGTNETVGDDDVLEIEMGVGADIEDTGARRGSRRVA